MTPSLPAALAALAFALPAAAQLGQVERRTDAGLPYVLSYPTDAAVTWQVRGPIAIEAAPGAAPRPGRHRLVVLSHGTGGSAVADHALVQALVREGLVVAQPLHRGDNFQDARDAGPVAFGRRPGEVSEVIDALAADPDWAPRLALDRVGVHGMSAGGVSALALAGAQWRLLDLVRHCNAHFDEDVGFCLQGAVTPEQQAERRARYASARGVPEFFLPAAMKAPQGGRTPTPEDPDPRPDRRIAAVTLAVPVAAPFDDASLARIAIPVGVVGAERDRVLAPEFHAGRVLARVPGAVRLAWLPGAGHFDLLWPWPEAVARQVGAGQVRGGLPEPGFDPALRSEAQARIAAFLRERLR